MPAFAVAPAAVLAALFALLFLLVYGQTRTAVKTYLHFNVGVGPFTVDLLGWVTDLADYTYAVLLAVFDAWVTPIANFILAPIAAIESVVTAIDNAIDEIAATTVQVTTVQFPALVNAMVGVAGSGLTQVISGYTDLASGVSAAIGNVRAGLESEIENLAAQTTAEINEWLQIIDARIDGITGDTVDLTGVITSTAEGLINQTLPGIEGLISTAYGDATAYAAGLFNTVEQDIANALSAAETYATTAVAAVAGISATDIDGAITGALSGIYTDIDTAITDVVGVIGTGDADVLAGVRVIPTSVPLDLAGLAVLTGAGTLTMLRYLKDCGIPNCQNLSQFGQDLQQLLGVVSDAAFLAALVELIHHPSEAHTLFDGEFGTVVTAGTALTRELIGA